MFRSKSKPMLAAVGAACATGALALPAAIAAPAPQGPVDVRVINTAANPVPVAPQGVTQVAGTVSTAPTGTYVEERDPMTMTPDQDSLRRVLVEVPAGKRFVAKQVNGEMLTVDGGRMRVQIFTGRSVFGVEPTPALGDEPGVIRAIYDQEMHFEVPGPGQVEAAILRAGTDLPFSASSAVTIVGRMVDCPDCQ